MVGSDEIDKQTKLLIHLSENMLVKGKDEGENRSVEKLQQDSTEGVVSSSSVLVYLYLCVFNSTLKKRTKTSIVASLLLILPAC